LTTTPGRDFGYPASCTNVISVASVTANYENATDSTYFHSPSNKYRARGLKDRITATVEFDSNPNTNPSAAYSLLLWATVNMNNQVDILGAGGYFSYGFFINSPFDWNYSSFPTSGSAPQVSGAIGLMVSQNECLSLNEVESILKITSKNIDHEVSNQFAVGKYGSGSLNTGRSVNLTHDLTTPQQNAYLENQNFDRWDFVFSSISNNVFIKNQIFTDASTVSIVGKKRDQT
jgi:hypothetical protein